MQSGSLLCHDLTRNVVVKLTQSAYEEDIADLTNPFTLVYEDGLDIYQLNFSTSAFIYSYYLPIFKPQPEYWSGLGISNLSSTSSANVDLTVYNQNGTILTTESKTIAANGQDSFIPGANLNNSGWIKVTSDQQITGLNFLGEYESDSIDYYMADVPFTKTLSESLVIPHVAQNSSWDTVVCLANPNTSIATVTLIYTNSGTASTPYVVSIATNGSKEVPVSTIATAVPLKVAV